jgi:hypothetical protein
MIARIKRWWRRRRPVAAIPNVAPVFERDPAPASYAPPRFRVQRLDPDGVLHEAYAGEDGERAMLAFEAYRGSVLYGEFTVTDTHHPHGHRGHFLRGIA